HRVETGEEGRRQGDTETGERGGAGAGGHRVPLGRGPRWRGTRGWCGGEERGYGVGRSGGRVAGLVPGLAGLRARPGLSAVGRGGVEEASQVVLGEVVEREDARPEAREQPAGGGQRAGGEELAAVGGVAQRDGLELGGGDDLVVADDRADAQAGGLHLLH